MSGLTGLWGREPAMVLALVQAVLVVLLAFGLKLTTDQVAAIVAVSAVVLGLLTRTQVTPAASPRLDAGTEVQVVSQFEPGTHTVRV